MSTRVILGTPSKEILPNFLHHPDYFSHRNIRVLQGRGLRRHEIDPATIDWSQPDQDGTVQFRDDAYGEDAELDAVLKGQSN